MSISRYFSWHSKHIKEHKILTVGIKYVRQDLRKYPFHLEDRNVSTDT